MKPWELRTPSERARHLLRDLHERAAQAAERSEGEASVAPPAPAREGGEGQEGPVRQTHRFPPLLGHPRSRRNPTATPQEPAPDDGEGAHLPPPPPGGGRSRRPPEPEDVLPERRIRRPQRGSRGPRGLRF